MNKTMDLTDDEDVLETSGEDVACGILDVHDVEGALVTLPKISTFLDLEELKLRGLQFRSGPQPFNLPMERECAIY